MVDRQLLARELTAAVDAAAGIPFEDARADARAGFRHPIYYTKADRLLPAIPLARVPVHADPAA